MQNMYYDGDIVISGVAGRFPDSNNMKHLTENLMNKVDLISDDSRRWILDHPEIPQRTGKVNNVEKFDALFFGIHLEQAHTMDPMSRMLLEHAYEAVVDAGINPRNLRGTNTGVFIAACISESEKTWMYEKIQENGSGVIGCSKYMLANRISYWLGVTGPSCSIDSACSSSLYAMENAYRAIRSGQCNAALVGGCNLCLHPCVSLQFSRLGVLSPDGRCKSFDADGDGYCRSEGVGVVYLQKAKDAKRIYATFVHAKINCDGFKEQGITFPSTTMQSRLFSGFYEECGVPPTMLSFIEAHGTGTKVGDPEELKAIDRVFCPGRTTPLKIGSIKSNLGHGEAVSGICSVAKILIAMETGLIPPNLHYKRPCKGVESLEEGRIKVVTEVTPWDGGYVGINSFGFGGANAHILLKSHTKEKINQGAPKDDLPRLVVASGRTDEAVDSILNDVERQAVDVEYVRLLHDIYGDDIPKHMYRGYTIVGGSASQNKPIREIQHYPGAKRPIWFVFSGMGSQWPGMGASLLRLPIFAAAIRKCDAALKPRNLNIYDILTNKDKTTFDNILNSFVGIAAIQIGLVDLLDYIGIVPDKIIGHSFGELGCAYADGCFTAEEMILAAFYRGRALLETDTIPGSMAAVGLGYENIRHLCPPDIEVACHNGPESSTISGPADAVKAFVAKLQANKIFAREIPCSNIAYHSRYIAKVGPTLLAYLQQVIPEPKPRSSKWVSTSVRRSNWVTLARLSSAEYHTNNLLSPVLFAEASLLIPKDAVTIEIAPHGLIQSILRRSLHPGVTNVGLTQRCHKDNVEVFLQGLGKLFNVGLHPQLAKLYPDVEFPVSRGTPMISPLIKWEHSADWCVNIYRPHDKLETGERIVKVTLSDEDYEYMAGHVIDGRNLIPATGYLTLVWETLAMMEGKMNTEMSVVIEDVKFLRATTIPKEGAVELTIMIQKGTGSFEVIEGGAAIVTGLIRHVTNPSLEQMNLPIPNDDDVFEEMSSKDIYKDLRLRGYNYSGLFRGIKSATLDATKGTITWVNNWVGFMDNMLQMSILDIDSRELFVPTAIRKLTIDTKLHLNTLRTSTSKEKQFTVRRYEIYDAIIAGGIEICGLKASVISQKKPAGEPVLESYQFVAHRDNAKTTFTDFITMSAHIALENNFSIKVKTVEAINEGVVPILENLVSPHLVEILGDLPLIQANVNIVTTENSFEEGSSPQNITVEDIKKLDADTAAMIVSGRDIFASSNTETLNKLLVALKDEGFLLAFETMHPADIYKLAVKYSLDIVLEKRVMNDTAFLLRKHRKLPSATRIIHVANNNFEWVPKLKTALKRIAEATDNFTQRIILVSERDFESGLLGLVQCLRKEPGGEIIRGYHIQDKKAPDFSKDNPLYADQLKLDLGFNVLRANGTWGTYRHLHLPEDVEQPVYHAWANQLVRGDLSSLHWFEGAIESMSSQKNLVRVAYAPINFRDVMLATGKLSAEVVADTRFLLECPFGLEYSGVDSTGRRVMGIVQARSFSNIVAADEDLTWTIPDSWTLEEAATVPCVYVTCYYALHLCGRMKKGNKVLIHAGTGGVGQAAINLALHEGCEVFTTVGTPEKRRFIRETFPQIADDHIGNSRDTSFEQMIAKETNGYGVDIVLNSLAEEKLQASVRCLAFGGRFLEIGKFDLAANNPLGMEAFLKEISFYGVMLDKLIASTLAEKKEACRNLMNRGLNEGAVKPLIRKVFPRNDMEGAFRYMAAGKHIGKVMIGIHDKNETLDTPIKALPRYYCRSGHSYVILGGLGGFGLELADWLVLRGANNLVLTSRTGVKNGYQAKRIAIWKSYGVNVVVLAGKDAYKREDCEDILNTAAKLGLVDAIFNLAVILKDALMENQTEASFGESFKAKAWGTMQLDKVSRQICPKLRHFVVFSSVVAGRGNAGQTNYGMANSIMERICERRVADGLPGLAIQWGAVGDVGLVADMQEDHKELVIGGTLQQRISSCLFELDKFLKQGAPIVASMVVAEKRAGGDGAQNIVNAILNIMGLKDFKTVSSQTPLAELGMDSMMAVEIKQSLEHEFEIFLTSQDIRNLNFSKILDMSAKEAAGNKSCGKSTNSDNTIEGMKLLLQIVGENVSIQEACLKLQTSEQAGRDEIFLIPGIEGYGSVFNNLAGRLKSPATCLQLLNNKTTSEMTIADMAEQLVPHVLKRSKNRRDFVIAAYSYGSVVAIELARKLEAKGMVGRLVLIDGSPELVKAIKDEYLSGGNEDELQTNIILSIMEMMSPIATPKLAVALLKCTTWSEKLDALVSALSDKSVNMTQEDQRSMCTAIYYRLAALGTYDPTHFPPLKSSIVLLKPTTPTMKNVSADYGLGTVSREKLEIFTVEGNHVSILDNIKVAAVINGETLIDVETFKPSIME